MTRLLPALAVAAMVGCGGAAPQTSSTAPVPAGSAPSADPITPPASTPVPSVSSCVAGPLAAWASRDRLWLGAALDDATDAEVKLDVRAQYLSGGFPSQGVCAACDPSCTGDWWGCWAGAGSPPGTFVRDFARNAHSHGELPYFTYYELLQASGASESAGEVRAAADPSFMRRYFDDFRFFLKQLDGAALVHLEPDFWGYAQQLSSDAHAVPAAVSSANPGDCGEQENSVAGLARCMIAMVRKYAPEARVGLHASSWATGIAALANRDPGFDAAGEARKLAAFLDACGAGTADFVALDSSDRDAGYDAAHGEDVWWDETNATLPNFDQALRWESALTTAIGVPGIWWQTPYGNRSLPDQNLAWRDNRLDYFFDHPDALARANTVAFVFGAGEGHQTRAATDGGHFVSRASAYRPPALCP
jgi:hypothetical protein